MITDALKSPAGSKTFQFGVTAVEDSCSRIEEWPSFCVSLYQIQHLHQGHYDFFELIKQILSCSSKSQASGSNGDDTSVRIGHPASATQSSSGVNGTSSSDPPLRTIFTSLKPGPLVMPSDINFAEPSEDVQDKIQFAVNNLAQNNFNEKITSKSKRLCKSPTIYGSARPCW